MGGSEEDDDPERQGFRVGVDLSLGAMCSLSKRERERKRKHNHNPEQIDRKERVHTHEKCMNM